MIDIKFNYRYCDLKNEDGDILLPKNGSKVYVKTIVDMEQYNADALNFVQMMDNGIRTGKEDLDYKCWNGCIYEDIDYKKFIAAHESYIPPNIVYDDICKSLSYTFPELFYYGELSRSGTSFHFIFFFKANKNELAWKTCKAITSYMVKWAFDACGYEDEIRYEGVYDDCTNTIYQPCFITKKNEFFNDKCSGDGRRIAEENRYTIEYEYNRLWLNAYRKKESKNTSSEEWEIHWTRNDIQDDVGYLNHHARWRLFTSLSGLCKDDDDTLKDEWEYCAMHISEGNRHTKAQYMNFPYKLDWARNRTGNEFIDIELLKKFGYDIEFKPVKNIYNKKDEKTEEAYGQRKKRVYL